MYSRSASRFLVFVTSTIARMPRSVGATKSENCDSATSSRTTAGLSSLASYFRVTPDNLSPLTCLAYIPYAGRIPSMLGSGYSRVISGTLYGSSRHEPLPSFDAASQLTLGRSASFLLKNVLTSQGSDCVEGDP